jgi:hypothetical protein
MKTRFILIFLFATLFSFGQDSSRVSVFNFISVSGGQFQLDLSSLNSQLKTWGTTQTFQPVNTLGINCRGNLLTGRKGSFDAALCLEKVLPQIISAGDSLKFSLNGWHIMTSLYGIRIVDRKHFVFTAGPGIDWGNVKIIRTLEGAKTHYNNPFISPFARAEMRVMFWKIMLGMRVSYRYEITKGEWTPEEQGRPSLPDSQSTGYGLQFFIGYKKPFP